MSSVRSAFTLLEVLVVITIIGVLTAFLVLNFQGVRERQELALLAEQAQAILQQAQAEVRGGKVRMDEDSGEVIYLCEGAFFEEGSTPLFALSDYDSTTQTCDMDTLSTTFYGLSIGSAQLSSVQVEGAEYGALYALFTPPEAELLYYDESRLFEGEGELYFETASGELSETLFLTLSSATDLIYLSTVSNEE